MEMENGEDGGEPKFLERKMAALDLADSSNREVNSGDGDGFRQIIKAVEDAEASIKLQAEENHWLRSELEKKNQELRNYKHKGLNSQTPPAIDYSDNHVPQREMQLRNQVNRIPTSGESHAHQIANSIILKERVLQNNEDHFRSPAERGSVFGMMRVLHDGQAASDLLGTPELFSPAISSFGPIRYPANREPDLLSLFSQGFMHIAEVNSRSLKQDLKLKIHEHEEEITVLRKHLAEYSAKEAEVCQEKHNLEKLIAHTLAAFDQQQKNLVDSVARSVSYTQVIVEENIRLTYTLQAAEEQRSAFMSSLMPLLAEYSLDSSVVDVQSAVGNVNVLFRHLRENLMFSEAKLKETQYQILPRHADMFTSNAIESPSDNTRTKDGLGLLQSPKYPDGNLSVSPDRRVISDENFLGNRQSVFGTSVATNLEQDQTGRYSPLGSRNETIISKQVSSHDIAKNGDFDASDMDIHQNHLEPPMYEKVAGPPDSWVPKSSSYTTQQPSFSYSPNLPVVSEEQSSFSEDDDLLPKIEGLQISGDAFPGRELQAYGISKNGTTNCNFEWVRHLEDGSFNYIEGANHPQYLITADDVNSSLAIEVQPLDDRNRKGELVKVFANYQNKITCDLEMHNCISRSIDSGHVSYSVSLSIGYIDMWDLATLSIKKNSYSIKSSGPSGVVVSEKYSLSTAAIIPFGSPMEFIIVDRVGDEHRLRADSTEISSCRDTIVLTLRYFILQAKKKKSKKRRKFFSK
ncbi:hypothetical protein LIER_02749 [Lithospermum erythrorhizon]|uniref:Uncharacterized protein n=1 Tax=Lithospermum erythrorhizon TaxID=34254 RepID=A0AAV3NUF8_LITER